MSHTTQTDAPPFHLDRLRAAFPALTRVHQGHPVAYFDGPGGTQVPQAVVDAFAGYLLHTNANTHWRYPTSEETDAALASARTTVADLLHCGADEVSFGANMSTIAFHLGRALARQWGPGDEIVITELDHHANQDTWRAAAADRGLTVRAVKFDQARLELDWDDFARQVTPQTKLVAIGAASNAVGTINDVARAVALAKTVGALTFVDAVHFVPHATTDVEALGCDFLACSSYKFYGPHLGILYGRRAVVDALDVPKLQPAPDYSPERLETGTQNHEGIVAAAAAVDFLATIGAGEAAGNGGAVAARTDRRAALERTFAALHARGEALLARLWHGLGGLDGVRLYGRPPGQPRTPTVAFTVAGRDAGDVAAHLAARGVFVSHGDFYASTVVARLQPGPGGLVRAGCACYTSESEVDRLIDGVRSLGPA
ncbi:MAG: cysteine desulfurase-like protein [Vicinamibacteraceae bacterium]